MTGTADSEAVAPVVTFTGSAAGGGTLSIHLRGALISVPVAAGESAGVVMVKAAAAINAASLTVLSTSDDGSGRVLNRAARRGLRKG